MNDNKVIKKTNRFLNKLNKGIITNTILKLYGQKENYSNIRTHVPSESIPSYDILLKLVSETWHTPKLKGFKLLKKCNKLRFYQNEEKPTIILVGIEDTNFKSIYDMYTICIKTAILGGSVTNLTRYKNDLKDIIEFQKKFPIHKYHYIGTGSSIAGAISDLFLDSGYLHEAVTFNPYTERQFYNRSDIKNYRICLDEDFCFICCGQYTCNTKIYTVNSVKKKFINPIEEFIYLYNIHN
jgi:hypothetical protein